MTGVLLAAKLVVACWALIQFIGAFNADPASFPDQRERSLMRGVSVVVLVAALVLVFQ